jgi:DMSO reductase family type II enzyme heme b subunit
MEARFASGADVEALLDPEAGIWAAARSSDVALVGTPAGLQPTEAIRNAWLNKPIGAVAGVRVAVVHNGEVLAFRLEWEDATRNDSMLDTTAFPDGAAVLIPVAAGAPLGTMGAPGAAVNAWYWRADENGRGSHVVAEGLGTTRFLEAEPVRAQGVWKAGRWRVVIARELDINTSEPIVQLRPGQKTQFGVAVWEGGHGERGGIKAFSGEWRELSLEPVALARR